MLMPAPVASPTTDQSGESIPGAVSELAIRWVFPATQGPLTLLKERAITIGRAPQADVVLADPAVSGRHAEISFPPTGPRIVDLGSHNGVFVNGKRCTEAALAVGDVLRLGDFLGVVAVVPTPQIAARPFHHWPPGLWVGPVLAAALDPAWKLSQSDLAIVLCGETGTGKEAVARALHEASLRRGPYLALNCAAVPAGLAEAELFGHAKGAFTGAERARLGYFREAEGGTLLLDEVTDLPLLIQAKLLRTLENREVAPVGESRPQAIDVRVIAATQRPLDEAVASGTFRADLYARLNGLTVRVPPLRARREEIPSLFERAVEQAAGRPGVLGLTAGAAEEILLHDFPFNVRELVMLARKLVALHGDQATLRREHVHPYVETAAGEVVETPDLKERLVRALRESRGNVARAAEAVGISRPRAYRLLADVDLAALRGDNRNS